VTSQVMTQVLLDILLVTPLVAYDSYLLNLTHLCYAVALA